MGIVGGWYMVAAITALAVFFAIEVIKAMRGDVDLTARQKVVRTLGGAMAMGILGMIALSRDAMQGKTLLFSLLYWSVALALGFGLLLMTVLDLAEVSRQFLKESRELRKRTLTEEEVRRLIEDSDRREPGPPS